MTPCSHPVTACNTLESTYTCLNFSYKIDLQPLKLSAIHIFIIHTHTSMLGRKNEHTKVSYSLIHAKYTLRMHKDNKKWMVLVWFVGWCCHLFHILEMWVCQKCFCVWSKNRFGRLYQFDGKSKPPILNIVAKLWKIDASGNNNNSKFIPNFNRELPKHNNMSIRKS